MPQLIKNNQGVIDMEELYIGSRASLSKVISKLGGSKAFIITGKSLNEKTPVIKELEEHLAGSHAGTYAGVRQHA